VNLALLLKDDAGRGRIPTTQEKDATGSGRVRIRCPRCGWEPRAEDRWICSCLHVWNTFDTGGICPACGRKWFETRCPRCKEWSPHADWYETRDGEAS
jgi:phage FluMu protein Com